MGRNGSEYGRNMVGIRVKMAGCPAKVDSYQIPSIPLGSERNVWGRVKTSKSRLTETSDVPAWAWPESPGFGLAFVGLGLYIHGARPKEAGFGLAWPGFGLSRGFCVSEKEG